MASIQATLQASKSIQGSITGVSNTNGTGVNFNVNFYQFPNSGGPFSYYIAEGSVPPSLSCASLATPLNPYSASSSSPCTATSPSSCAIGALSGKHGTIASGSDGTDFSFQKFYLDLYLSTVPGSEAYFGGRAIVIADEKGVPVNCANFPGKATGGVSSASTNTAFSFGSASSNAAASTTFNSGPAPSTSASAAATSSAAAAVAQRVVGAGSAVGMGMVAAVAVLVL